MRLKRNLTTGEIIDQVLYIERNIGKKITNVVFMGMGEPFQNYDNVIKAAKLINHPEGLAVGVNHIVISTAGIVPAIYRYTAEKHKFKLAISLQSAIDEKRKKLMPVTKTYPLARLIKAIKNYVATLGRRPTFEYVLIQGINDSDEDARALGALVNQIPCKINLIPYNPTGKEYKRPSPDQIDQFAQILMPLNAPVSIRWSKGDDVNAACGQLGHNFHKSKNNN
jgi:23S rRNA (adenine2503-C2)-methyltransferase